MTITNFRSSEPMYLVIIRDRNAETLLKNWAHEGKFQVTIEKNRMKLYEARTLSMFQVTWTHNWSDVTIWDYWNRRHLR